MLNQYIAKTRLGTSLLAKFRKSSAKQFLEIALVMTVEILLFLILVYCRRPIFRAIASTQLMPSMALDVIPPAYPAPSPQGYRLCSWMCS